MSKLANHIALFYSRDNTRDISVKYIDPVLRLKLIQSLDWIQINSPHFKSWFIRMRRHFKSSNSDWTRFQVLAFWSNCADLKSSPVLIVGFEILHRMLSVLYMFSSHDSRAFSGSKFRQDHCRIGGFCFKFGRIGGFALGPSYNMGPTMGTMPLTYSIALHFLSYTFSFLIIHSSI
jgi:hypothetical protein